MQFETKKDFAYHQIKNDILCGNLKPGDKLVIRTLAAKYGMSYIPIREAHSQLFHEGLVHTVPYTGTKVADIDVEKVFEATALRNEVEILCLKTAIPYITSDDIHAMRDTLKNLYTLYEGNNIVRYMVVNHQFYSSFYEHSPYRYLKEYLNELYQTGRTSTSLIASHYIPESLRLHDELISLVERGDVEGAVRCHRYQKRSAIRAVTAIMREVLLHPEQLESSHVDMFYRREQIDSDKDALIRQLDRIEVLFPLSAD